MKLEDLEIYTLAREISCEAWIIYQRFDWRIKKIIGDQWIEAVDSVGANIAEGFGRFHYLDKNKFNYNSRGSLTEGQHWTELLFERNMIIEEEWKSLMSKIERLHLKLNNYIGTTRIRAKSKSS